MKIGILQTGYVPEELAESTGEYPDMFAALLDGQGFEFTTYPVVDMVFPENVQSCDGWLITGSRHGVYEDHPWIPPLEEFIRDAAAADVPLIGICFGHQIIAQALGGRVEKFDGGWGVGRQSYKLGDRDIAINAWHQDQVVALPAQATCLGGNAFCENAVLIYGRSAFTMQPHPEFDARFIEGLIETRGKGTVPDDLLAAARAGLPRAVDTKWAAEAMARFLRERRITND